MPGLRRTLALLLGERGLVDQQVGAVRGDPQRLARPGVAREDELASRPGPPITCSGPHTADGLAALNATELGSRLEPEPHGCLGSNTPGRSSSNRTSRTRTTVRDRHRCDPVAVARQHVARRELHQIERKADAPAHPQHQPEQRLQPGRPGIVSGRSRPRRSKVLSIPGSPSQWSAWKWVR